MSTGASKLKTLAALVYLMGGLGVSAFSQVPPAKPIPKQDPVSRPEREAPPMPPPATPERFGGSSERALAVDPNVNIQLPCISDARVTVNGWQRDEIRVFVRNGTNVGFKVHEKSPRTGKPVWVVVGRPAGAPAASDCISGERIDIEVPIGAMLKIVGRETDARIDSVKKVEIKNLGGNVALRNVTGGIYAETYEGDVTVENSSGQISLKTSTGNIIAAEVGPGQVGDLFKAATQNGSITLQKVEHRQIEANSVSGEVVFNGKFLAGGIYSLKTSEGNIRLMIPKNSSCRLAAWYGFGTFKSELPIKTFTNDVSSAGKSLTAEIGAGDATLNLTTHRGRILIVEQPEIP